MNQKITVIHHSADFDGLFCREIARKFLPDAELIGWDYGNPKIPVPEGKFYILDLSPECLEPDILSPVDAERMIWIDHHASAIKKFPNFFPGYRIDGVSACRLAWQWFILKKYGSFNAGGAAWWVKLPEKQEFVNRTVKEPIAVRLAGEYDIWDKRDPDAELFQNGLRSCPLEDGTWDELLEPKKWPHLVNQLLLNGLCLQYAKNQENAAVIKRQGHTVQWEGLTFLACNHAMFNSHLFTEGIKQEHDALMGFRWDGQHWHFSLYHAPGKEHHDLSLIAVKYGGGGHRGACGFRAKTLPFIQ